MTGFLAQNWGNIASVAGLVISIWVLVVARKAKQAAEETRSAARRKNLSDLWEEARNNSRQVNIFLKGGSWEAAQIRAEDVSSNCRHALARWGDTLPESAESDLLEVAELSDSIIDASIASSMRQLTEDGKLLIVRVATRAHFLISSVLGEARKAEERSGG